MKKVLISLVTVVLIFSLAGCKKQAYTEIIMDQSDVSTAVNGWVVHTNPQFRYEFRLPQNWTFPIGTEGSDYIVFYTKSKELSDSYIGNMVIKGFVNWNTDYTVDEYIENELQDLQLSKFDSEEIIVKDFKGRRYKNVDTLYSGKAVDLVIFELWDRIVEIHLIDDLDNARIAFNSFNFYDNQQPPRTETEAARDAEQADNANIEVEYAPAE
ncbi:hypothetical protein A2533_02990 [Candidatus Falkowbacteria bacterium RIFOXYD2_FULL_35_9]|uniref:Lipoprotein n=1 Tax=Candidatus Falkowbacteria bacterium RIFOXYC2_FULL_36_12 TaxID=1798002 RepID=A0A1F5SYV0_9BACT|nr:MAG: hypothetical protein A2300_00265 [Candidatus Falkowbacteria bacterium RIFOXYB2_FULL_35_7]OGF31894.1 MAG: hypothetical protein A2478_05430 [Candidatus Falkowbacteria bacterium RIFOXYC2_FULL_36_12]OGF33999.1 MAG: hypothetical protein A2223_01820 [Candidatus Falkowbacteria bacterium RIFOXYA2_FULL_35_8]OGF47719.1 MAG: hypothetical protein A2533_02990 [Candidatus Falkowbacteria bacterium RIFOXYD2_FULL_35_9]